ncbi:MAG TPA: sensor domain-containing diguanylate cyclase [Bacillota bacterium]|nr:sensor domain-containing diguanylate cyclase [Bacillota bacterium]
MESTIAALSQLGNKASSTLYSSNKRYNFLEEAGALIYEGLVKILNIQQVRLYLVDATDKILRDEVVVNSEGALQGNDAMPLYQIPDKIVNSGEIVTRSHGALHEALIPLKTPSELVGLVVLTSNQKFPKTVISDLPAFAEGLTMGIKYVLLSREAERTSLLLKAATRMGRELQGVNGADRLLYHFVTLAVEQLDFDRATLFVFAEDGKTVKRGLVACTGHSVKELKSIPKLPKIKDEPYLIRHIPGLWVPMRIGSKLLGAVIVDNLYTGEPIPEDITQTLVDLSGQVALSLENARLFDRIQQLALRDDLTGLYRARYFYERVQEELEHINQSKGDAGLLILDLDHYKQVNDFHGHPSGDAVLVQAAELIKKTLRSGDIACRMGGDEFIILASGVSPEQCTQMANRILKLFKRHPFKLPNGNTINLSVSIGTATFPFNATNWQQLINQADQALYQSKQRGRGQVTASLSQAN